MLIIKILLLHYFNKGLDIVNPLICIHCGELGRYICPGCFRKITLNWEQRCHVCKGLVFTGMVHKDCTDLTSLDGLIYPFHYEILLKELIHIGKYNLKYDIFRELGKLMGNFLKLYLKNDKPLISFVPLHPRRFRERGFNQTEVLSKSISKITRFELGDILQRTKYSVSQVKKDRQERVAEMRGKFALKDYKKDILNKFSTLIIVDDVYTSGSTLNDCARAIKKEFPDIKVYGFVIARST